MVNPLGITIMACLMIMSALFLGHSYPEIYNTFYITIMVCLMIMSALFLGYSYPYFDNKSDFRFAIVVALILCIGWLAFFIIWVVVSLTGFGQDDKN